MDGPLFNPGILGSSFIWWIGQIADDSTWRDNILPGKYPNKESPPGWGARYKVRIMGVHDQGQVIAEEDLPWANIMYPVTGGGGQMNSWMSSNLRQGNMVFGFYMDGPDMQVPIIMGVLGNNAQTDLGMVIGKDDNSVTNAQPGSIAKSGYAQGAVPKEGTLKEKVPDSGLVSEKPKSKETSKESAALSSTAKKNQYGLPANQSVTQTQQNDIASAKAQAEKDGLTGDASKEFVKKKVEQGVKNRVGAENKPFTENQEGVTAEGVGSPHQLSSGDVKTNDKMHEKIVLMNPDDPVESATKAIQTEVDTLTEKVDKFMGARKQFIDAASGPPTQEEIQKHVKETAKKISKYQKIIMDKIGEFQSKKLNEELTKTVAAMPSSMRYQFADQKILNTEDVLKKYNEITNKMSEQMEGILTSKLKIPQLMKAVDALAQSGALYADPASAAATAAIMLGDNNSSSDPQISDSSIEISSEEDISDIYDASNIDPIRTPKVPVCYAEDIVAQGIAANKDALQDIASSQHRNFNRFIEGVRSQLGQVDKELEEQAYDRTDLGKVTEFTDEEEDDLPQGGTNYYTETGVPCSGGTGSGFKVDITVPSGGLYDNGFLTINDEGAGYTVNTADSGGVSGTGSTTGATTTGGSGTGIQVNYTISGGKITGITTSAAGANYKNGDVLTVVNNASGTPSTNATFTVDKVRGTVNTVANGGITIADPGNGYTMGDLLVVQQEGSGYNCGIVVIQVKDPGGKKATAGPVSPGDTEGSVADSKPDIGQKLGEILPKLGDMAGSMTQALDFLNNKANMFPFESPANTAVSDYYTLATGGAGQPETEVPNASSIDKAVSSMTDRIPKPLEKLNFAEPGKGTPPIDLVSKVSGGLGSGLTKEDVNKAMKKVKALKQAGNDVRGKLTEELKTFTDKNKY